MRDELVAGDVVGAFLEVIEPAWAAVLRVLATHAPDVTEDRVRVLAQLQPLALRALIEPDCAGGDVIDLGTLLNYWPDPSDPPDAGR